MLAMLGLRFRDVEPIIISVVPILFFLTPVLFFKKVFSSGLALYLINLNPFTLLIEIARSPVIGVEIVGGQYFIALGMGVVGWMVVIFVEHKNANRLIFWI